MMTKHTLRLDAVTAQAVKDACVQHKITEADFLREAVRMRLDVSAMVEPLTIAIAEALAEIKSDLLEQLAERLVLMQEGYEAARDDQIKLIENLFAGIDSRFGTNTAPPSSAPTHTLAAPAVATATPATAKRKAADPFDNI